MLVATEDEVCRAQRYALVEVGATSANACRGGEAVVELVRVELAGEDTVGLSAAVVCLPADVVATAELRLTVAAARTSGLGSRHRLGRYL